MVDALERFWAKVDKSAGSDECWPWRGALNPKGYGQFRHDGQMRQAHRWILGALRGSPLRWDDDLKEEACHHCDYRACCNPAHLYIGSHAENMQDCLRRGRNPQASKTHCPQGHEYTPENTYQHAVSGRQCKMCNRQRVAAKKAVERAKRPPKDTTCCIHGHPWTPENTYWNKGTKYCRACNAESRRRRQRATRQDAA